MLPPKQALPLGLLVIGASSYVLADGTVTTNAVAKGSVTLGAEIWIQSHKASDGLREFLKGEETFNESLEGGIVLGGDDILIGMDLIRRLRKCLMISSEGVALLDKPVLKWLRSIAS